MKKIEIDGVEYEPKPSCDGMKAVVVRAYSGVFFGYLREKRATEVDLVKARHIWQWTSAGLMRKALTVEDVATIGAGTGTKISGEATLTVADWKTIVDASDEAVNRIGALPCLS